MLDLIHEVTILVQVIIIINIIMIRPDLFPSPSITYIVMIPICLMLKVINEIRQSYNWQYSVSLSQIISIANLSIIISNFPLVILSNNKPLINQTVLIVTSSIILNVVSVLYQLRVFINNNG